MRGAGEGEGDPINQPPSYCMFTLSTHLLHFTFFPLRSFFWLMTIILKFYPGIYCIGMSPNLVSLANLVSTSLMSSS